MNNKFIFTIFTVLIMALSTVVVFSLDDQGNENDPTINERANACFEDGSLEGKCDTEWEWVCGWYLIRFEYDMFSREEVPSFCESVLPPLPVAEEEETSVAEPSVSICAGPLWGFAYMKFDGSNYSPAPTTIYSDVNCTITYATSGSFAYAPGGQTEAQSICDSYLSGTTASLIDNNVYICST